MIPNRMMHSDNHIPRPTTHPTPIMIQRIEVSDTTRHAMRIRGLVSAFGAVGLFCSFLSLSNAQEAIRMVSSQAKWSIAIHGGAGGDPSKLTPEITKAKMDGLRAALMKGKELLQKGTTAIDVVQAVVEVLEDDPNFNAGRGGVFNSIGQVSMDASMMDGRDLSCGAVANVTEVRNPIRLARAVRDKTPHVLLTGSAADAFAKEVGIPLEPPEYFKTPEQQENWEKWKARQAKKGNSTSRNDYEQAEDRLFYLSTVGCVVRDTSGNLAAATSTGGLLGKKYGRVGDSPIIGAGTYAKNKTCAVSCTGEGELFIKHHVSSAISTRMELLGESLAVAAKHEIEKTLPVDSGGIIAVDLHGNIELQFNTPMMARGRASSDGLFQIGLVELQDLK
ncbi:MAG: isoaspartyl peptidase/L-asparaginase [Planctomycetes bacterium]|nr:isoaspartyl peptidase/L-asparaginase [Planctomycetota bacterium]